MKPSARVGSRRRAVPLLRMVSGAAAVVSGLFALSHFGAVADSAILPWLTTLVGLAALLDGVVNDILPARFCWRAAVRQRHFILATMAFCYVAQLYVAFFNLRSTGLLIYYLWNAGAIMALAFFDAHQRSKEALCVIICT